METGLDVQTSSMIRERKTRMPADLNGRTYKWQQWALAVQVTPDQWHTFDCTIPKEAATDEPNVEEITYHKISHTRYHNMLPRQSQVLVA